MKEGKKSRQRSILFTLMCIISLVVVATSAVFTSLMIKYRTKDIIDFVDKRLATAAEMAKEMLGADYHDHIADANSVPPERFRQIVARNDDLCRRLDLQYLWSVMSVDDRLVFTSATHSDLHDPASPCAAFFETHRDPGAFASVLQAKQRIAFSSFHNEWGEGRQVLIAHQDTRGRTYIFGASVQLTQLQAMTQRTIMTSTGISLLVMGSAFILSLLLARSFSRPIDSLTRAADRMATGDLDVTMEPAMTRELQSLTDSLEQMRQGLKRRLLERRASEDRLRESETRYRNIFNNSIEGIFQSTLEGRYRTVNPAFARMLGYDSPEQLINTVTDIGVQIYLHPEDRKRLIASLNTTGGKIKGYEIQLKRKDGTPFWVSYTLLIVKNRESEETFIEGTCLDISERKKAEAEKAKLESELQQAQKMDCVGRLAGGVAHDFNNMLGVIVGQADMAAELTGPEHPVYACIVEIQKAAQHSSELTRQLLAFARKQTITPQVMVLNETVAGMLKMLDRLIGENIRLDWQPAAKLWPVKIDPSQVDQILVNLCVNARDAIADVGQITITTGNFVFAAEHTLADAGFMPGEYVGLSVRDTGCGMDKEILSHIFEPFFTTKDIGKGTGLGLATVYGAVKQNNGFIHVDSVPGSGSTFTIYLPRYVCNTEQLEQIPRSLTIESEYKGTETVLLVEDEPSILKMTKTMLSRLGYKVLAANSPAEGIRLATTHNGEIHLLITDVVMPEMNGRDLAQHLLSIYPNIKTMFMSGYTADIIAQNGVVDEKTHFLQKPFSIKELAAEVRKSLAPE